MQITNSQFVHVREGLLIEIKEVWTENQRPDWDGYGARPVAKEAGENARGFVHLLPAKIRDPEVVPESDGSMGFEWRDNDRILALSFLQNGSFTFAAHFPNKDKVHGSGKFNGEIPAVVETLLHKHFREGKADAAAVS